MDLEVSEDGSAIRLGCKLSPARNPSVVVTWFQNDDVLPVDSNQEHRIWSTQEEDGVCLLTICDVDDNDSGVYTCKAKSSTGEAVTRGELDHYEGI